MNTFSKKLKPLILVFTLCIQSSALLANSKLDKFECPRTLPSSDKSTWYDNRYAHHNDVLAVHLYDAGSRLIGQSGAWRQDDGYIHSKYPWIKKVAGKLKVQGQRLDGKSDRPFKAVVNDPSELPGGVPGGFLFPDPGCWEISGSLAGQTLTFIIEIIDPE